MRAGEETGKKSTGYNFGENYPGTLKWISERDMFDIRGRITKDQTYY